MHCETSRRRSATGLNRLARLAGRFRNRRVGFSTPDELCAGVPSRHSARRRSSQTYPSTTDPRSNLKPGRLDAGTTSSNMKLVSFSKKPAQFDTVRGLTFINSDLAFA